MLPGKSESPAPFLEVVGDEHPDPAAVVLIAHGGRSHGRDPGSRRRLAYWRMRPFGTVLERAGRTYHTDAGSADARSAGAPLGGVAVYLLRYRYRGWNGATMDAYRDARWAVGEITRRHPGRPVALLGHSMGGRAVLRAAGEPGVLPTPPAPPAAVPRVVAVCALAPWIEGDPVEQLAGRSVLIAHGDRERMTDPAASLDYARRARRVTDRVARFSVRGDGHAMLRRAADWSSLVRRFVLGELGAEPLDRFVTNAMRGTDLDIPLGSVHDQTGVTQ